MPLQRAIDQLTHMLRLFPQQFPEDTTKQGRYPLRQQGNYPAGANVGWTSGFWTGMLWLGYQLTGSTAFRHAASAHSRDFGLRLQTQVDLEHHDLGFLYQLSCVAAEQICALPGARATALHAAERLAARFLPAAGIIQAWGRLDDPAEQGRVIIDSVMNLPLLHWASGQTGDARFSRIAQRHLEHTRAHLIRPDGSTYHTYFFDPANGAALFPRTHQGRSDDSCWARGQAWAIYGYALNHRYLPELGLLDSAMQLADYFLAHLPDDRIALWDLSYGAASGEPRDSSASAIAACGLYELAAQLEAGTRQRYYAAAADQLLDGLTHHCSGSYPLADGLLTHTTYHRRAGIGIEECSLWGDYYYLEALARRYRGWQGYTPPHPPGAAAMPAASAIHHPV